MSTVLGRVVPVASNVNVVSTYVVPYTNTRVMYVDMEPYVSVGWLIQYKYGQKKTQFPAPCVAAVCVAY